MSGLGKGTGRSRRRTTKNQFVTKAGNTIKVHRSLTEKWVNRKDARFQRRADRQASLPKTRLKRFLYHFQPKRMAKYWFSRDGGIMALKIMGVGFAVGFLVLVGLFAFFRKDLPNLKDISGANIGGSISYYDRTGQTLLWEDYDAVKRIPVKDENISNFAKQATVAVEDKDFFKHGGFDVRGIIRAGYNDATGGSTQGGSTITQQLVKLTQNWTQNRSVTRKVKELILAVELEREYTKPQILAGYLNAAPYGNIEYGVEAAANDYFHKSAKDLTLDEAAMLAAIPKSPAVYSPYGPYFDKAKLLDRQHYVLDQMVNQGMIPKTTAEAAKKVDVVAKVQVQSAKFASIKAPWFVLAAKTELENKYGANTVNRGGWRVTTTLDMGLQSKAEELVTSNLKNVSRYGADEEAIVGEDVQSGQIVSLVGGTDFYNKDHGQNNFGAGILLPPGSSFKPYDYTTLIDNNNNVGAGSVLYDTEGALPGYPCTNKALPKNGGNCLKDYDFLTPGPITLRYALGGSRNIPAVKAMLSSVPNDSSAGKVDSVNKVISTASAMMANPYINGNSYNCYADEALKTPTQCYGAAAIGDGAFLHLDDHVNGLSTLGRMGKAIPKTYIMKITDAGSKIVSQFQQPKGNQVIKPDSAYIVNDMASDPNASYLPGSCTATSCTPLRGGGYKFHRYNGWHLAVKTGTTNDGYDGLMTSWSTKYAVVSWVGNHTRHVNLNTTMESLTEPMTRGWMENALASDNKPVNWTPPTGLKTLPAFVVRNHIHYGDIEPSPANDLFPSWYQPKAAATSNKPIDKVSGKLATDCTPPLAKDTSINSNASNWNVDIFVGGSTSGGLASATSNDDVHNCDDAKPTISLSSDGTTATYAQGTHPLSGDKFKGVVNFVANGQVVKSVNVSSDGSVSVDASLLPGGADVYAEVIDSVLYSTSSNHITAAGSSNGSLTILTPTSGQHVSGSTMTATWSGGGGPYSVLLKSGGGGFSAIGSCTNISTQSCVVPIGGNNSYQIKVTSSSDTQTVSFSKP